MGRSGPGGSSGSLSHYGVKGMKWGVTRTDAQISEAAAKPRPSGPMSDDVKSAVNSQRKIAAGGTQSLSNQELQGLLTRMNLERQYRSMTAAPPKSPEKDAIDQGLAAAKKALAVAGTIEKVHKFAKSDTGKAIKKGVGVAVSAGLAYATGGTSAAAAAGAGALVRTVVDR